MYILFIPIYNIICIAGNIILLPSVAYFDISLVKVNKLFSKGIEPNDERINKLLKIRPYRRITKNNMNEIWPEWDYNN
jgi:hypothetical protein